MRLAASARDSKLPRLDPVFLVSPQLMRLHLVTSILLFMDSINHHQTFFQEAYGQCLPFLMSPYNKRWECGAVDVQICSKYLTLHSTKTPGIFLVAH